LHLLLESTYSLFLKEEITELIGKELEEIDGGIPIAPWIWQGLVITFVYNCIGDWDENVAAFKRGEAKFN
jgi:hypothetical protein